MRLVDAYGADDHRSMAADNTSAFNCRFINGQPGVWSQHAFGKAIDIDPIENSYVTGSGFVSPPAGSPYADRSRHARGMVHRGDPTVRAFSAIGWGWADAGAGPRTTSTSRPTATDRQRLSGAGRRR
ncbi:MAG: M15 family metallopeptidase [Actinomycetota bacterium]